jgi:thioredoxin
MKKTLVLILVLLMCLTAGFSITACGEKEASQPVNSAAPPTKAQSPGTAVKVIESVEEFKKLIGSSPNRLLIFDLYADWCGPCRTLSPMLEEIAKENKEKADFFKINVDKLPQLAGAFKVSGIPHVSFLKDKTIVLTLVGVRPKSTYVKAVNQFSEKGNEELASQPDGEIVSGVRVIRFKAGINPRSLYIYRGETVKLVIEKQDFPFSVHIPAFDVSKKAAKNEDLEITFKAKNVGVYPIFCNGNCPAGDGALHGKIIVMQYKAEGEAQYKELTAQEAKAFIEKNNPLILDVRTPREYYSGYLPGAVLIPLQQLTERVSEIEKYKDKEVLIYCRSGNRSTVAGEILIQKGFKKIYNIRDGMRGWIKNKFDIKQAKPQKLI